MLSTNFLNSFTGKNVFGVLFLLLFYMTYSLVLLFYFIAIIMSNYLKLKSKMELTIAALSNIASKKSQNLKQKWFAFL